jgi:hypothetical protein
MEFVVDQEESKKMVNAFATTLDGGRLDASCSSFSSDESSCAKSSPPTSSAGLRRSTIDLRQLDSNGILPQHKMKRYLSASLHSLESMSQMPPRVSSVTTPVKNPSVNNTGQLHNESCSESISLSQHVLASFEERMKTFVDEVNHHIGTIYVFLLSTIFASKVLETAECPKQCSSSEQKTYPIKVAQLIDDEPEPEELLSPSKVTPAPCADSKDDWGHFAYFQDELTDESCLIPSCSTQSKPTLGTLDESEEEDDEEGDPSERPQVQT